MTGGIRMCKDILPKEVFDYKPKKLWDHLIVDDMYFVGIINHTPMKSHQFRF